ncbi:CBS domain-containing protein [Curvibacter sp. HBC61]|uniref:CBS domain-containing protein n=1 Tax=Curvibacter cyanobacteriorum TaxID=3026422 RepID=A0ABT5N0Q5_9BURK|nr:CBS domain-containing protein [Curvibacter sp. HBC61]MDD0839623.1 CBS domain-containing protein [Curvibacter sp. HBC61]
MFYVYGLGGPLYRGPLENLAQVSPVRALSATRRVQTATAPGQDPNQPPLHEAARGGASPALPPLWPKALSALSAYADTQQGPAPAREPLERVQDVMSREVLTLQPDLSAAEAWERLAERGFGQAPVVSADQLLVGLLLRADLLPASLLPGPAANTTGIAAWQLAQRPVSALMLTPVPAVAPDTHLRQAARVLLDMGLPGLPVTLEGGQVVGFLSRADILRAVVADPPLDLWT